MTQAQGANHLASVNTWTRIYFVGCKFAPCNFQSSWRSPIKCSTQHLVRKDFLLGATHRLNHLNGACIVVMLEALLQSQNIMYSPFSCRPEIVHLITSVRAVFTLTWNQEITVDLLNFQKLQRLIVASPKILCSLCSFWLGEFWGKKITSEFLLTCSSHDIHRIYQRWSLLPVRILSGFRSFWIKIIVYCFQLKCDKTQPSRMIIFDTQHQFLSWLCQE